MAGFFLSTSADAVSVARHHFHALGHEQQDVAVGPMNGTLVKKKLLPNAQNLLKVPDGQIFGAGVWVTASGFGGAALADIFEKLRAGGTLDDVAGHFAFAWQRGDQAYLYADKSGTLPVYKACGDGHTHYSTSFLALASVLKRVTFGRQEVLEFLNVETTLGDRTLFEEIEMVPFGTRTLLSTEPTSPEDVTTFNEKETSYEQLVAVLAEHMTRLKTVEGAVGRAPIGCDFSGGFDSRLVAALLNRSNVSHLLNTNVNRMDPGDHELALKGAISIGRPLVVYAYPEARASKEDVGDLFDDLDMCRDAFRSKRMLHYFNQKSTWHPLLLGGYGGELFRSVYSLDGTPAQVVSKRYCQNVTQGDSDAQRYRELLTAKFERTLLRVGGDTASRASEKIYFFEKMRAWGGTRIATHNRYAYSYHPLLDLRIQRHMFAYPVQEKLELGLQKRLIGLDPELAKLPYLDEVNRQKLRHKIETSPTVRRLRKRAERVLSRPPSYVREAEVLSKELSAFAKHSGVALADCKTELARGRYLTLGLLYQRFQEKIST